MSPCVVNVRAAFKQARLLSKLMSNLVLEKEEEAEDEKAQWNALSGHKTHASDISYISKGSNLLLPTVITSGMFGRQGVAQASQDKFLGHKLHQN